MAAATPTASRSGSWRTCPTGWPPPRRSSTRSPRRAGSRSSWSPVAEDQFNQMLTSNAAAGDLPDVIGALPLGPLRTLSGNELVDTDAVGDVIESLDAETFSESALALTADGDDQLGGPERVVGAAAGLPQGPLRRGRAGRARDLRRRPGRGRGARQPRRGRLRRRQRRRRRLHRADLRGDRPRQRLRAGRRRGRGHLRQRRVRRGAGLLRHAPAGLLGDRCPGRRHHAGVVLRRPGRDDHLVELHPRRDGRAAERRAADLPGVQGRTRRSSPRTAAWSPRSRDPPAPSRRPSARSRRGRSRPRRRPTRPSSSSST